jgi:uncharacterized Zn-finger protein
MMMRCQAFWDLLKRAPRAYDLLSAIAMRVVSSLPAQSLPLVQARTFQYAGQDARVPCPLCGQRIKVAMLKQGENWCPHCFEKFTAE